jgi:integrase
MAGAWIEVEWRSPDNKVRRVGRTSRSKTDTQALKSEGWRAAAYYVGYREPGSTKKTYKKFGRYEEARAYMNEVDGQLQRGTYVPRKARDETVEAFVERMFASAHNIAPSTLAGYRNTWENHVQEKFGNRRIGEVSARDVQEFVDRLVAGGVGNGTLAAVRQLLAKVFNQAVVEGVVSRAPTSSLRVPKERKKKLSRETLQGWADAMRPLVAAIEPRYRLALYLAGVLGLRAGEIGGLRVQDVDFIANTLTVRQAVRTVNGRPEIAETKTAAGERTISVPGPIMDEIAAYMQEYAPAADGRIFQAAKGGLVNHTSLNKALQKAIQETGSPPMRFHDLRHLAASTMIAVGIGPSVVKERLGHSTLAITMDRYSHLFPEQDRDAADRLANHVLSRGLLSQVVALPAASLRDGKPTQVVQVVTDAEVVEEREPQRTPV